MKKNINVVFGSMIGVMAVFILVLSIGYGFFSDSLTVKGVASTVDYYTGENLPVTPVIRDTTNNRYYTTDNSWSLIKFDSETWEGDSYHLYYYKSTGCTNSRRTNTFTITFTNPTVLDYTEGQVSTEILFNEFNYIKGASANMSSTEVGSGQTVDINLVLDTHFLSELGEEDEVKATISYVYQNKRRTLYFYFHFINKFTKEASA